jgi:hypothetical protein
MRFGRAALVGFAFAAAASVLLSVIWHVPCQYGMPCSIPRLVLVFALLAFLAPSTLVWLLVTGEYSGPSPLWDYALHAALWFLIPFTCYILARNRREFLFFLALIYIILLFAGIRLFGGIVSG